MPSRQDAQENLCKPESIPRWSHPVCILVSGILFQSQDTPLKYTRTIDKPSKIKEIWRNPRPAEKRPGGSLQARTNPQVIASSLYISPLHVVPISRHTIEIHRNHWKTWQNQRNLKKSMPSREDAQEELCQPESIPRWSLPACTLVPGMWFQSQDTPLKYMRTI